MSPELTKLLSAARLGGLTLRNRVIKTATFESMTPDGVPTQQLIDFHVSMIEGGAAMTTLSQCNVSPDARVLGNQPYFNEDARSPLETLTRAVHMAGGKISGQLTHAGYFTTIKPQRSKRPLAPSSRFNRLGAPLGRPFADAMSVAQIRETVEDYARTARLLKEVGFDAVEIMMCHGYLVSQFISADVNRRRDEYGGSLEQRMRFPTEIVQAVRAEVGSEFPILAKINLDDASKGGIKIADAVRVAQRLERSGIDGILTTAGKSSGNTAFMFRGDSPVPFMISQMKNPFAKLFLRLFGKYQFDPIPFHELYLLDLAREIRAAVRCPVIYVGGVCSVAGMETAMAEGFDFVGIARALINDPQMINRINRDPAQYENGCTHCNQCIALIYDPRGVHCVLNAAGEHRSPHTP